MDNRNKNIATILYKSWLILLIVIQVLHLILELTVHCSMFFIFNAITLFYFIFRLYIFIKIEKEAKAKGQHIQDYMDNYKNK